MIEGMRPYTDNVASGLSWVDTIPAHWEQRRIKTLLQEVDCRTTTGEEKLLSLRMLAGLVGHHEAGGKPIPPEAIIGYKRIEPGQLVMNRMRAAIGLFGVAREAGLVSPDYAVFAKRSDVELEYLLRLFKLPALGAVFRAESKGLGTGQSGFLRLYTDKFGSIRIPLPPLDEQRLIVRFLDWHGAMTGKLIRAKRRLIALLNEQKQSIIHRAVTRGLDPVARLKPSGVEWLGDVPEHWGVMRLKFACRVNPRTSPPSADSQVTFLPMENVGITGQVDYSNRKRTAEVSTGYTLFQKDDVILAKITPCFENGKGAHLSEMPTAVGYGSTEFIVLRPMPGLLAEYAYLLTVDPVFRRRGTEAMTGSAGQQRVSPDFVANWVIGLPSEDEQHAICAYIREHTAEFDTAIQKVQSEVQFIQEFRARLIADVVTGQIDVRAVAATLPDIAEADVADLTADDDMVDDADDLIDEEEAA